MRRKAPCRLGYQHPGSTQTLAEGLGEYYAANLGKVTRPPDLPLESLALFRNHDMCHVLFGLDTTAQDEALVDIRTLLSSDVGLRRYAAYLAGDPQAQALLKELGLLRSLWVTILVLPRIARALVDALRARRRWPWDPPASFQARPLADLRRDYGIHIV